MNDSGSLDGILVFFRVLVNDTVRIFVDDLGSKGALLVEAKIAVVAKVAVERENASTTKALLHLENDLIAIRCGHEALNLDNVLPGLSIDNADIPVAFLKEVVVLRADVAGTHLLGQVVVGELNFESNNVDGSDNCLAFALDC